MFWRKESNRPDALYSDLFKNFSGEAADLLLCNRNSVPQKNDGISIQKRKKGNDLYGEYKWAEAMRKYNESLCFATKHSENISLAYANRALCFLRLKLYKECLIDIDLARQAGYPKRLMSKLDQRESDCLKHIEDVAPFEGFIQKLSFDPDENFPCMANVLTIQRNEMGDSSVIAKEDIDVGQIIVFKKSFFVYLLGNFEKNCNICMKSTTNLMPCKQCASAMFCSDECQRNVLHEFECGRTFQDNLLSSYNMQKIRALALAISLFTNADELMSFVEQAIKSDPTGIPASLKDERSKYRAFLRLSINEKYVLDQNVFFGIVYGTYKSCLQVEQINRMFESLKHRRFLMHLIGHIELIMRSNSCFIDEPTDYSGIYYRLGLMRTYFNHSCAPNVAVVDRGGLSVFTTVRPIEKGEQLFISLVHPLSGPDEVRQQTLHLAHDIICKCTRCEGTQLASKKQQQQLISDPKYQSIMLDVSELNPCDNNRYQDIIQKCVDFLRKYGQIGWCDAIERVMEIYRSAIYAQIKHPMHTD